MSRDNLGQIPGQTRDCWDKTVSPSWDGRDKPLIKGLSLSRERAAFQTGIGERDRPRAGTPMADRALTIPPRADV
jgi:hypothetical protein